MATKSMYHIVWCNAGHTRNECASYLRDMRAPWYRARFITRVHHMGSYIHTYVIARKPNNRGIAEIGVWAIRHGAT